MLFKDHTSLENMKTNRHHHYNNYNLSKILAELYFPRFSYPKKL